MRKKRILIIGAGLAGLSCAFFLKRSRIKSTIFEKEKEYGGLCRSAKKNGFTFDFSGHLLHFRNLRIKSLVRNLLGPNLVTQKRRAFIYSSGKFIPYPFQSNFHGLPEKVSRECLLRFIEARGNGKIIPKNINLQRWLELKFGRGIARHFMVPYNSKFWKMSLDELSSQWADRFIPTPRIEDIIESFVSPAFKSLGYNAFFSYPMKGGIVELTKSLAKGAGNIFLDSRVEEIYPGKKQIVLRGGRRERYDSLISTLPLPELAGIIKGMPGEVSACFGRLKWLSIYNINLGLSGVVQVSRHWFYFPQNTVRFFRVGFYHNFSSHLTPPQKGSLYAEFSYLPGDHVDKKKLAIRLKEDLRKVGLLSGNTKILAEKINDIKYGYPIYDTHYKSSRGKVIRYLTGRDIIPCGRYGSWRYLSMEDVILDARKTVKLLSKDV